VYRHFESAIRPLLHVTRPGTMVEVGAEEGFHTFKLLSYARSRGAHLHVIEPYPRFDVALYQSRHGECSTLHRALSHEALPLVEAPDAVFLDGDHNWYTVLEELRILDRTCVDWPLTFAHDVDWPYGRRDMYYAPDRVPDDCRQPYALSGIVRGSSELSPTGVNGGLANATHEGGPRNGVLTAVEDFLDETQRDLALCIASGSNGLGIIIDRRRLRQRRVVNVLRTVHDHRVARQLSPNHASSALA
jgi:hypothetical protein